MELPQNIEQSPCWGLCFLPVNISHVCSCILGGWDSSGIPKGAEKTIFPSINQLWWRSSLQGSCGWESSNSMCPAGLPFSAKALDKGWISTLSFTVSVFGGWPWIEPHSAAKFSLKTDQNWTSGLKQSLDGTRPVHHLLFSWPLSSIPKKPPFLLVPKFSPI